LEEIKKNKNKNKKNNNKKTWKYFWRK